ncbi:MAG TPA: ABC transporter permease subunit [Kofleriaceae bacterium]|nr:ABC transporter permease subunit [Kofleriaceae bacterium]
MDLGHLMWRLLVGYPQPAEMIDHRYPTWLQRPGGLVLTLLVTALSLALGLVIGCLLALGDRATSAGPDVDPIERVMRRGLRALLRAFIEIVRGLPIMLLVLLVFYLPYRLFAIRAPAAVLAIVAFSIYAGVYLCEILLAGFRSVDRDLLAAGQVLGLSPWKVFLRIELPIAARNMSPDLINLAVTVFKDTSTLAVVAMAELTYTGRIVLASEPAQYAGVMFLVLVYYWIPATLLSAAALRMDRRRATARLPHIPV